MVAAVRSGALRRTEKTRHIDQANDRARSKQPGELSCRKKSGGRILITIPATANGAKLKKAGALWFACCPTVVFTALGLNVYVRGK